MKHVVMYSGGAGSWAAAKRVAEQHGTDNLILYFTDTKTEDEDLYRFLHEGAANIGGELVIDADGRDIWQVFFDSRYLGNSRIDPCSRILKRERSRKWVEQKFQPDEVTLYVGIDWTEIHRLAAVKRNWQPYAVHAPMCEPPYIDKPDVLQWLEQEGIEPPRLYEMGFSHNNCGGFCVKAGLGQFYRLYKQMPERYRYHEQKEQELREYLGKDVSFLRQTRGGELKHITMREFREQIEAAEQHHTQLEIDLFDIGGCGCFVDIDEHVLADKEK